MRGPHTLFLHSRALWIGLAAHLTKVTCNRRATTGSFSPSIEGNAAVVHFAWPYGGLDFVANQLLSIAGGSARKRSSSACPRSGNREIPELDHSRRWRHRAQYGCDARGISGACQQPDLRGGTRGCEMSAIALIEVSSTVPDDGCLSRSAS